MARVVIELWDGEGATDGAVHFEWRADPPVGDGGKITGAQRQAMEAVAFLQSHYKLLSYEVIEAPDDDATERRPRNPAPRLNPSDFMD